MDTADGLDFNEGLVAELDVVMPWVLEVRVKVEGFLDLLDNVLAFDENDEGGVFKKFCLRNVNPGARPRDCLSTGVGEPIASEVAMLFCRDGVDFLKTANLYRSTTPRANRLFPLAPFLSSPSLASIKSQSSSSSSRSVISSVSGASGR